MTRLCSPCFPAKGSTDGGGRASIIASGRVGEEAKEQGKHSFLLAARPKSLGDKDKAWPTLHGGDDGWARQSWPKGPSAAGRRHGKHHTLRPSFVSLSPSPSFLLLTLPQMNACLMDVHLLSSFALGSLTSDPPHKYS